LPNAGGSSSTSERSNSCAANSDSASGEMETTAFSLVCDQVRLLSTPAGLMTRHPTGASYSVILSLPSEALNLRPGFSTMPVECSLARNVCDPGPRTEWMTLPRAVALLGPALSGMMSSTYRATRSTPRETPLSRASSALFIRVASAALPLLEIPFARTRNQRNAGVPAREELPCAKKNSYSRKDRKNDRPKKLTSIPFHGNGRCSPCPSFVYQPWRGFRESIASFFWHRNRRLGKMGRRANRSRAAATDHRDASRTDPR